MLKLHGEGDPSGAGLAFSFIRVSMKDIFLRAGESAEEKLGELSDRSKFNTHSNSGNRGQAKERSQI